MLSHTCGSFPLLDLYILEILYAIDKPYAVILGSLSINYILLEPAGGSVSKGQGRVVHAIFLSYYEVYPM